MTYALAVERRRRAQRERGRLWNIDALRVRALAAGMTEEAFWRSNPRKIQAHERAEYRRRAANYNLLGKFLGGKDFKEAPLDPEVLREEQRARTEKLMRFRQLHEEERRAKGKL